MQMKVNRFRLGVAVATMVSCLSVYALVPLQFVAPVQLSSQSQEQQLRQYAASLGVDVSDVPRGQLSAEKVINRIAAKSKREANPRAEAIVRQYAPSEADFTAALRKASTPEELLALRTDLQQRICQIAYGCIQIGCSNEEAVRRSIPVMQQLDRVGKKIDALPSGERAKFDEMDGVLQARLKARNEALQAVNNQIMNNLIQQTSQPLPLQNLNSGGSDVVHQRKRIRSVGNCPLHGSYEMATGCPGCKGNVDYGSGKQMFCSRHNLKFDSSLGCPLCNRIGDEGRYAPTWR